LWKLSLDEHPAAKATSTPVFYKGRLYVGASSLEEAMAVSPSYVCCTFRGSVSAVQASDGKLLWKASMIEGTAKPQPKTKKGSAVWVHPESACGRRRPSILPATSCTSRQETITPIRRRRSAMRSLPYRCLPDGSCGLNNSPQAMRGTVRVR